MSKFIFYLLIFPLCSFSQNNKGETEAHLPESVLCSSVLVSTSNQQVGSGLFLEDSSSIYFVTAKHVLFKNDSSLNFKSCILSFYSDDIYSEKPTTMYVNLDSASKLKSIKYDMDNDVAILKIGIHKVDLNMVQLIGSYVQIKEIGSSPNFKIQPQILKNTRSYSSINIGGDIYLFGYPSSISKGTDTQFEHSKPLLRKGIIAGKNGINKKIIIDCPVYFGNSGGPVFELVKRTFQEEVFLIGIAIQYIPYVINLADDHKLMNIQQAVNSGYAVVCPIDYVFSLIRK